MSDNSLISDVKVFGSAIIESDVNQRHAGIVFKDRATDEMKLLHLGWHYILKLEKLPEGYSLVPMSGFDEEELQLFAESASKIFDENAGGIPYGIAYTGATVFNGDLKFIDAPGAGLTCATFILGFFAALGFQVVDLETWEHREDDVEWQERIYKALEKRLSKEQAVEQKSLIGSAFRFRPEEVVGAVGIYEDEPLGFPEVVALGLQVLREMQVASSGNASVVSA